MTEYINLSISGLLAPKKQHEIHFNLISEMRKSLHKNLGPSEGFLEPSYKVFGLTIATYQNKNLYLTAPMYDTHTLGLRDLDL